MRCPVCDCDDTRVVDSRPSDGGAAIRRRRACIPSGHRFTTYERAEVTLLVVKRDGTAEPFQPEKVRVGISRAMADRPMSPRVLDALVQRVETFAAGQGRQVTSDAIGREVLAGLKEVDEVGYLRFASVYEEFEGARDFERAVAALEGDGDTGS